MSPTREVIAQPNREEVETKLIHHWALDPTASSELASGMTNDGCAHIDTLLLYIESQWEAVKRRDENREEIRKIQHGESDKNLYILGPCSLDTETDYNELFDYVGTLQEEHPDTVFALRLNGSKPRTKGGNTGLFNSVNPADRDSMLTTIQAAFSRGIPILTEVVDTDEFGMLAPYLSGMWLGARDMTSTSLRTLCSATNLPVFVKNGTCGDAETVENAIGAIGKNTADNDGSGVNLGFLAHSYTKNGWPTPLTVGEGNKNVGIIARGYKLPKYLEEMDAEQRDPIARQLTMQHIGELCTLAAKLDTVVLLDGGHDVPAMVSTKELPIKRDDGDRFPKVLDIILEAAENGEITGIERLRGFIAEISTTIGNTDKNMIINDKNKSRANRIIQRINALHPSKQGEDND